MKTLGRLPTARGESPPQYERFFDAYYNLGPPSEVFESGARPVPKEAKRLLGDPSLLIRPDGVGPER